MLRELYTFFKNIPNGIFAMDSFVNYSFKFRGSFNKWEKIEFDVSFFTK